MKEPILSREQFERLCDALPEGVCWGSPLTPEIAAALESALLEKLCGEPVAWMVLECVHLKPCSVTLDREDIEGHRPEHVVSLYALNRNKA